MLRVTRPGHITDVVDADLSKYFDTIPHNELLRSVAARIVDRYVLRLIKAWLKALVEETDPDGPPRVSGGKQSTRGTSQGGVVTHCSPTATSTASSGTGETRAAVKPTGRTS